MNTFTNLVLSFQGLFWMTSLAFLVYLFIRRIGIKKKETFEDRNN
jgi:hypothetical protein